MSESAFLELEFVLLVLFSFVIPAVIYLYLFTKASISRLTVLFFALCLMAVSGADLVLLSLLRELAQHSRSVVDDKLFAGELRLAFYLLPVVFVGTGVNLLSHVLVHHLTGAEQRFDREKR